MVRAKFRVTEITHTSANYGGQAGKRENDQVVLEPAMDDENKTWARYTPCGKIQMTINNPLALDEFKPGECYFVDFTLAPQKESEEK
jgi:hypothetical protein